MISVDKQTAYWDSEWTNRTVDGKVKRNVGKFRNVLNYLWNMAPFALMEKLEIGCGTGSHAYILSQYSPYWKDRWTGIDLSVVAVQKAVELGLNASVSDIFEYDGGGKRFELFLFLDSLEHIEDHERLGGKIKELAQKEYSIYANVPMYLSGNGDFERQISIKDAREFLNMAGCGGKFLYQVYGIDGCPYLSFEGATSEGRLGKGLDHTIGTISNGKVKHELS